jgi:heme exporter protein A
MSDLKLVVTGLGRDYNRRPVFRNVAFTVESPGSVAITGLNGAGKSTIMKILAGVVSPTAGTVRFERAGVLLPMETVQVRIGFVSPYLNLYDEFSAEENLQVLARIRSGVAPAAEQIERRLRQVDLWNRRSDLLGTFSSGMKQRLKYAAALLHDPEILMLDEPASNLDSEGAVIVREAAMEHRKSGMLIVATNNEEEAGWCGQRVHLTGRGARR